MTRTGPHLLRCPVSCLLCGVAKRQELVRGRALELRLSDGLRDIGNQREQGTFPVTLHVPHHLALNHLTGTDHEHAVRFDRNNHQSDELRSLDDAFHNRR